jgi:hypothetical protein
MFEVQQSAVSDTYLGYLVCLLVPEVLRGHTVNWYGVLVNDELERVWRQMVMP